MPKAINISLQTYNTAHIKDYAAKSLVDIINDNNYMVIVIDDPDIGQRLNDPRRPWMNGDAIVDYFGFADCNRNEVNYLSGDDIESITSVIKRAKEDNKDLIVSCIAGLSRSGAVVQAAVDFGFIDAGSHRKANIDILLDLKSSLGISINQHTSAFNF